MIEYLSGRLVDKSPTHAVILCGGVGYGVLISLTTYDRLPDTDATADLHTYLAVREDALTLYGFAERSEREMFLQLITVSGIGPKIAIGMLSSVEADALRGLIMEGNIAALQRLPGIGRKTAERITVELRDRVATTGLIGAAGTSSAASDVRSSALDALVALGYSAAASEKAIRAALKSAPDSERSVEALLKAALKNA